MGLCAQAADERSGASWNAEGKKEKTKGMGGLERRDGEEEDNRVETTAKWEMH